MRRKILWVTFWMTMVYWLGQASGCTAAFWQKPSGSLAAVTTHPTNESTEAPPDHAAVATAPARAEEIDLDGFQEQVDAIEPSLRGMDRSHWKPIKTSAAYGTVRHRPIYLLDCAIPEDDKPLDLDKPESQKLAAALAGAEASGWNRTNRSSALANPPKFGFDLLTLPIKFIMTPGWKEQYSP